MSNSSNTKQLAAGRDMDARRKLADARKALLSTLSNGTANTNDIDTGTELVDVDPSVVVRLNAARSALADTLSGVKPKPKQNSSPAEARDALVKTMSSGRAPVAANPIEESTVHYFTSDGHQIASTVTPGSIMRLNQAKRELAGTMSQLEDTTKIAMAKDELVKTMKQNGGIRNQTEDSGNTITPSGTPFSGGFPINVRSRGRTLEQLLAAESADKPSPSPAVSSGQGADEDGDYAPNMADVEFQPEKASAALLDQFSRGNKILKGAAKYFLAVSGDENDRESYHVPLAVVDPDSQLIRYHPAALSAGWKHASGEFSGTANRILQQKIVKIKQANAIPLDNDENDFIQRHMAAASRFYDITPSSVEIDEQTLKYDAEFTTALRNLQKTIRSK